MNDIPTIGDNFPPEPTPFERWAELVDNANVWAKNVPKIANSEQASLSIGVRDRKSVV